MRILFLTALLLALPVHAEVYRWIDAQGVVHYTDKPPDKSAKPVHLPALQTYSPGATGDPFADQPKAAPADHDAPPPAPSIVSPKSGATLRDAQRTVDVDVNAALRPGEALVYSLDGQKQNTTPTTATHYQLSGVERGTHHISVTIVDADGRPLATSSAVTLYMKPPTVHHP